MELLEPTKSVFCHIQILLSQITNKEYTLKCKKLSDATIGQHLRHLIEWYIELNNGYKEGIINYDNRKRNKLIETDIKFTIDTLNQLLQELNKKDKTLFLAANFDKENQNLIKVKTTYFREVLGNLEHAVHHMALIKIALTENTNIQLPKDFGVAMSSLKSKSKS